VGRREHGHVRRKTTIYSGRENVKLDFEDYKDIYPAYILKYIIPKLQEPANIVLACKDCDKLKNDRIPDTFIEYLKEPLQIIMDKHAKTENERKKLLHFCPLIGLRTETLNYVNLK